MSDLGRRLHGPVTVKHNIKRVDRLLGNGALHGEAAGLYEALARQCLAGVQTQMMIIDWSDLTPDRHWRLLRASMALAGRSVTLYEAVHPLSCATAARVHARFLKRLAAMLPPGCMPILITDAGFRGAWFKLVTRMGWHWVGRIRNRDLVRPVGGAAWTGCKTLYTKATGTARALGQYQYVRSNPVTCRLALIRRRRQGRRQRGVHGKPARSNQSHKHARAQREPWLLAVCPGLAHLRASAVVALYGQRMQIEEAFRDLKSERFGLRLSASRSKCKDRVHVLLLIACLASCVLRLIGEAAKAKRLELRFHSNMRRSRPVLSAISLALQLVRNGLDTFPQCEQRCSTSPSLLPPSTTDLRGDLRTGPALRYLIWRQALQPDVSTGDHGSAQGRGGDQRGGHLHA